MKLRKPWQQRLAGRVGAIVIRLLGRTWRVRGRVLHDLPPRTMFLFLHGKLLMPTYIYRDCSHLTMIGTHRDGEIIAQVATRLGFHAVRGSTTRGGSTAALELLRRWPDKSVGVTPDGPRGPLGTVRPALMQLAARGGYTIIPLGFESPRAWRFKSWDRFTVPKPFARVECIVGETIEVPADIDEAGCEALAELARERLAAVQDEAGRRAAAE